MNNTPHGRGDRSRRDTKPSRWESDTHPQAIPSSKWDNLEAEADSCEPSKKKTKPAGGNEEDIFTNTDSGAQGRRGPIFDEDLDGVPLDDSSPDTTRNSSGSR